MANTVTFIAEPSPLPLWEAREYTHFRFWRGEKTWSHRRRGGRAMTAEPVPQGTNWGRWGADDERGALNHLDGETVLAGTRACRTGRVYPLGLPIGRTGLPTVEYRGPAQRLTLINH